MSNIDRGGLALAKAVEAARPAPVVTALPVFAPETIVPLVPTPEHDDWFDGPEGGCEDSAGTFSKEELEEFRKNLLEKRAALSGKISSLQAQSLTRPDEVNPEEDGTDASMRNTELAKAAMFSDTIRNIDAALRAIDEGNYGICTSCGRKIGKGRIAAQPFAKLCIDCQSELEADAALHGAQAAAEYWE